MPRTADQKIGNGIGAALGRGASRLVMEGIGETCQLLGQELRVSFRSGSQRRAETACDVVDHLPKAPRGVVRVVLPCDPMRVEKNTGPRLEEKLVDLTAYVSQIDIAASVYVMSDKAGLSMSMRIFETPLYPGGSEAW